MFILCSFLGVFFLKRQIYMRYTIYVSQAAMVALCGLASLEFMVMMGLSDFCMNPAQSVYNSLAGLGIIQQTAKSYFTCRGLNPIHRSLAESYLLRDHVGKKILSLFDPLTNPNCPCLQDRTVINSFRALQSMHVLYENLAALMDCSTIKGKWESIFNIALCTNTMNGVLGIWIAGAITALGVFLVAISASVLMLYFDKFWELEHANQEKVQHMREDLEHAGTNDSDTSGMEDDTNDESSSFIRS